MTLILSIITDKSAFIVGDKMHSLDGTKEEPVNATITTGNGMKINVTSQHIRIQGNTKIYRISDSVCIGGAGDYEKVQKYLDSVKGLDKSEIFMHTYSYYAANVQTAPEQLLVLSKNNGKPLVNIFAVNSNDERPLFYIYTLQQKQGSFSVSAIGSGSDLFNKMYQSIYQKELEKYQEALKSNTYEKWEKSFIEKIQQMYSDISKYDDAVSSKVDIIKLS